MQKAIQGKLRRSGLRDVLKERVGFPIHNFNVARSEENTAVLYVSEIISVTEGSGQTLDLYLALLSLCVFLWDTSCLLN